MTKEEISKELWEKAKIYEALSHSYANLAEDLIKMTQKIDEEILDEN